MQVAGICSGGSRRTWSDAVATRDGPDDPKDQEQVEFTRYLSDNWALRRYADNLPVSPRAKLAGLQWVPTTGTEPSVTGCLGERISNGGRHDRSPRLRS